jgi:hypothetical protein
MGAYIIVYLMTVGSSAAATPRKSDKKDRPVDVAPSRVRARGVLAVGSDSAGVTEISPFFNRNRGCRFAYTGWDGQIYMEPSNSHNI